MTEITFRQDTRHRKQWFKGLSFAHPAKMHLSLQIYLIENYTQPGDTILDPMLGSGTLLVACSLGRNVIGIELEQKFVDMAKANWEKIKSQGPILGYKIGEAVILQGDARNLPDVLADCAIFSPPYARDKGGEKGMLVNDPKRKDSNLYRTYSSTKGNIDNLPYGQIDKIISSPPYAESEAQVSVDKFADPKQFAKVSSQRFRNGQKKGHYASKEAILRSMEKRQKGCGDNPSNIGNLPYGSIDKIISSPPYANEPTISETYKKMRRETGRDLTKSSQHYAKYSAKLDVAIFSPPYEAAQEGGGIAKKGYQGTKHSPTDFVGKRSYMPSQHGQTEGQIGNLKSENYLSAMLQAYQGCHSVLKDGGLLVLVVKNFIRNKQIIRLDLDTIKLCEQAGFTLIERLARKLTQQSFWRHLQLNKCDHRRGSKNNPRCKLGLSCPVKKEKQMIIGWKEEKFKPQKVLQEVIEKLCSMFVNTTPRIEFEDVLVFVKETTNEHEDELKILQGKK